MLKHLAFVSVLVTAAASASAQTADATGSTATQAPAPVVRAYQANPALPPPPTAPDANQGSYSQSGQGANQGPWDSRGPMARRWRQNRQDDGQEAMQRPAPIVDTQPVAGVWLRSRSTAVVRTISATPQGTEVRLEKGVLNVNVHHPSQHIEILVDLPGGQTSLLKDGLYTFNADTNTVRVLRGEAAAFPNGLKTVAADAKGREKGIKVKEDHQLSFVASTVPGADRIKAVDAYPYELATDLLPAGGEGRQYADVSGEDGPYGYPYYAGVYPYGYYPGFYPGYWGYGYPYGYGIGIAYYGGFGGYRGGYYRGGFRR